jgi:hypothetical protein
MKVQWRVGDKTQHQDWQREPTLEQQYDGWLQEEAEKRHGREHAHTRIAPAEPP